MGALSRAETGQRSHTAERNYLHADIETMPREQLARLQLQRLQATVANAYTNVALVRQRFESAGLRPADIRSRDDIAHRPFTVKTDLRDQ